MGRQAPATEEEWEFAARGTDGRMYPWGNDAPTDQPCWSGGVRTDNRARPVCPVGSKPNDKSPVGALDMAGNVHEWTSSPMCNYSATGKAGRCKPEELFRVKRGGDHYATTGDPLRATQRVDERVSWGFMNVGFRCAKTP